MRVQCPYVMLEYIEILNRVVAKEVIKHGVVSKAFMLFLLAMEEIIRPKGHAKKSS